MAITAQVASYVALTVISITVGYWAGSLQRTSRPTSELKGPVAQNVNRINSQLRRRREDSDSDDDNEDLSSLKVDAADVCKLALVVRTDLGMTAGKIAAQCSHATLACYKTLQASNPALLRQWERTGQTKIALRCADEEELLLLQAQAASLKLCARSIQDAGRTQIAAGSRTVLGIAGPGRLVNQVTSALKLL